MNRFKISNSEVIDDGWFILDKNRKFSFSLIRGDEKLLISYCKALNSLNNEIDELQQELFSEKDFSDYLQACHDGDVKNIKR